MAIRPGETPVPIPNTMVKTRTADGTVLETVWKSRWLPDYKNLSEDIRRMAEVRFLSRSLNECEVNTPNIV